MKIGNKIYSSKYLLLSIVGIILIGSFLVSNAFIHNGAKRILLKELLEDSLPAETNIIAQKIKLELLPFLAASSDLANDFFLRKWIIDGEPNKEYVMKYLVDVRERLGSITCFLASDISMKYYNPNGDFVISKDDPDTGWYFDFKESGKNYELNLANNVDMGDLPTIFVNHRINAENGDFLGIVGVGLKLAEIPLILNQYNEKLDRSIYFINADGNIVTRSAGALFAGNNINKLKGMEDVFSEKSKIFEYINEGEHILVSTQHIPELDWWLLIEQHKSLAMETADRVMAISASIGISSIVLTMLLVFMTVSFFHQKLKDMAATDRLTGISNRMAFENILENAFCQLSRSKTPFSILLIDIDKFKLVNDTYGHLEGDNIIKKVVNVVKDSIRQSDKFCRWGGEEFVVLAYDCNIENGVQLAEKIRIAVKHSLIDILADKTTITISIGVSEARMDDSAKDCIERADKALYCAKRQGRDLVIGEISSSHDSNDEPS